MRTATGKTAAAALSILILGSLACGLLERVSEALPGVQRTGQRGESTPPAQVQEQAAEVEVELPRGPVLSALEVEPFLAYPGETLTLRGDGALDGMVQITGPDGAQWSTAMQGGSAEFALPQEAMVGAFAVWLAADDGALALGSFRVIEGPGLYLTVDRSAVVPGEQVRLRVHARDVDPSMTATVSLGGAETLSEPSLGEGIGVEAEQEEDSSPSISLVPNGSGALVPGTLKGVPLSEYLGRELVLAPPFGGELQVVALPADAFAEFERALEQGLDFENGLEDELEEDFEEPQGELSNAVLIQRCSEEASLVGEIGAAGWVQVVPINPARRTVTERVAAGNFSRSVPAGWAFVVVAPDDGGQEQASVVNLHCGEVERLAGLGAADAVVPVGWSGLGRSTAAGEPQEQSGGGEVCRQVLVDFFRYESDSGGQRSTSHAERALSGALQTGLSRAKVTDTLTIRQMLWDEAEQVLAGASAAADLSEVARGLDADILVTGTVTELPEGDYLLVVVGLDVANPGRLGSQLIRVSDYEELGVPSVYGPFVEDMKLAGVCGEIEPKGISLQGGEEFETEFRLTDLAGRPAQARVEIEAMVCGEVTPGLPQEGGEDGTLTIEFKAIEAPLPCVERLEYRASMRSANPKRVETRSGELAQHVAVKQPEVALGVGALSGAMGGGQAVVGAVTIEDDHVIEQAPEVGLSALQHQGSCEFISGYRVADNERYQASSNQPGHRGEISVTTAPREQGAGVQLGFEAFTEAVPPDTSSSQPIHGSYALVGAPAYFGLGYFGQPVALVVDIVNEEQQPLEAHVRWRVTGGHSSDTSGWNLTLYYAQKLCGDGQPDLLRFPESFYAWSTLVEASSEGQSSSEGEWVFSVEEGHERAQLLLVVIGGATSLSEVFNPLDGPLLVQQGQASFSGEVEVELRPVAEAGER